MPAARISSALVNRVAQGIAGTGAAAVIEDGRVRVTIVANGAVTVLPSPDEGGNTCDDILKEIGCG